MRIAQIAPLTEAIPPKLYGGTERVVSWLTEELVALGHDVTLFASGDLQTTANLEPMWPRALRLDNSVRDPMALHMAMLEQVRQRAGEFDILHFHLDYFPFSRVLAPGHALHHHDARPARPARAPDGVQCLRLGAGHLDFRLPTPAIAAGALAQDRPSRPAGRFAPTARGEARLSRLSRPHRAGEGGRPGDPHRPALQAAAQDRGQSRPRRSRLFRTRDPARCSVCPASTTSARSATRTNRRS